MEMQSFEIDENNISSEMQQLRNEIQCLKDVTNTVINQNVKILTALEKGCENIRSPKANFPVSSPLEIEELENKVKTDFERYVIIFRSILMPDGIHKYLHRILSEELCFEMNYSGRSSKKGLRDFVNLNRALYESIQRDGYSMSDYTRDVCSAFQKIKNKKYKAVSLQKKNK
ncbi:uncharacterized protein [Eurosta solidaginis]|uniref:uncharacterized protein n=1 Tax=Eurosta solidaginis TaxID=178769 RepID=UPI0035316C59